MTAVTNWPDLSYLLSEPYNAAVVHDSTLSALLSALYHSTQVTFQDFFPPHIHALSGSSRGLVCIARRRSSRRHLIITQNSTLFDR